MSEPVITRRCPHCGGAYRVRATFCPHCGQQLKTSHPMDGDDVPEIPEAEKNKLDNELHTSAPKPVTAVPPKPIMPGSLDAAKTRQPIGDALEEKRASAPQTVINVAKREAALPEKPQRVKAYTRDVVSDNLRPRVEKLREASNVVLDGAADDPGLRFVLIAAILIIISIVILWVSLWR